MEQKKYSSYEEALKKETIKNLDLQNKELEKRAKLEESLNILAVFAILGIVASLLIAGFVIINI